MAHLRKQIRDAVEARLTGLATTGNRIHQAQVYSVQELPALLIYMKEEVSEIESHGRPAELVRVAALTIEGLARTAGTDLPDRLDQIALEVEKAMNTDITFSGLVRRVTLQETEIDFLGEGESQDGRIRLTYRVQYLASEDDPETAL